MALPKDTRHTYMTLVWAFPRVCPHVSVQFAGVFEGSAANGARVGALLRVNAPVYVQVLLHTESLEAKFASGIRQTRVRGNIFQKVRNFFLFKAVDYYVSYFITIR